MLKAPATCRNRVGTVAEEAECGKAMFVTAGGLAVVSLALCQQSYSIVVH